MKHCKRVPLAKLWDREHTQVMGQTGSSRVIVESRHAGAGEGDQRPRVQNLSSPVCVSTACPHFTNQRAVIPRSSETHPAGELLRAYLSVWWARTAGRSRDKRNGGHTRDRGFILDFLEKRSSEKEGINVQSRSCTPGGTGWRCRLGGDGGDGSPAETGGDLRVRGPLAAKSPFIHCSSLRRGCLWDESFPNHFPLLENFLNSLIQKNPPIPN